MKTLNENQNWSNGIEAPRPKIGDDDGISNRAMNYVIILFTILTLGISVTAGATQNDDVKYRILLRQAMLDIDRLDYDKAIVKLLEVRANSEENANVNHLLGKCYLNGEISNEKAVFYLSRAAESVSDDYEEWDLFETNAPFETVYLLATAYENLEHYDMAAELYALFLGELVKEGKINPASKTYAIINKSAKDCQLAAMEQGSANQENIVFNQ